MARDRNRIVYPRGMTNQDKIHYVIDMMPVGVRFTARDVSNRMSSYGPSIHSIGRIMATRQDLVRVEEKPIGIWVKME